MRKTKGSRLDSFEKAKLAKSDQKSLKGGTDIIIEDWVG